MRRLALLLFVAGASFLAAGTASAVGPPLPLSGTAESTSFFFTGTPKFAGGNVIAFVTRTGVIQGTITGTYEQHLRSVQHADGRIDIHGFGTVTGTVDGCGTGAVAVEVTATFIPAVGGTVHVATIKRATNTLHVQFNLNITGGLSGVAAYSGTYICL